MAGLIDAYSMIFNGKFVSHDMPDFFMAASKVAKHLRTMFQYVHPPDRVYHINGTTTMALY
jgi:hypothetical protein